MQVRELMSRHVISVAPQESAALAARLLARHNLGALPVADTDGKLRGVVTDRDIVLRVVAAEEDPAQTPVREIMSRRCAMADPEEDAAQAAERMSRLQVRRLPVVKSGRLVGMLSLGDLARQTGMEMEAAEALGRISDNIRRK